MSQPRFEPRPPAKKLDSLSKDEWAFEAEIWKYDLIGFDYKYFFFLSSGETVQSHAVTDDNPNPDGELTTTTDGIDLNTLELSASQESCLNRAISTVQEIQSAPQTPTRPGYPLGVFNHMDTHSEHVQAQSSYRAPVYYFNNCSVTINHKWIKTKASNCKLLITVP